MARVEREATKLSWGEFSCGEDLEREWENVDFLALPHRPTDRYVAGFAVSRRSVEAAQRLRFEVFNLELEEGLSSSMETGLDRDEYDDQMSHLVLIDSTSGRVVGTYRMQSIQQGLAARGVYSAEEYDLEPLAPYFDTSVELGRACLAQDHRNFRAMIAMWLGIGAFMNAFRLRYAFGCCSLTTQDPDDGWRAMKAIREGNCLHPGLLVQARSSHTCGEPSREFAPELGPALKLPKLFRTYLRLGCKVVSEPAIDRAFGTIDFLILIDSQNVALSTLEVVK